VVAGGRGKHLFDCPKDGKKKKSGFPCHGKQKGFQLLVKEKEDLIGGGKRVGGGGENVTLFKRAQRGWGNTTVGERVIHERAEGACFRHWKSRGFSVWLTQEGGFPEGKTRCLLHLEEDTVFTKNYSSAVESKSPRWGREI